MASRPTVLETVQLGVETTPGTAVSADKRIFSWDLDCDPVIPTETVESMGNKAPTDVTTQKEMTKVSGKGQLDFNALVYLLSSLLEAPTITTPSYNGVWTVNSGTSTGGTFTLTFNGQTTATIAYNANAATVQSALEALSTIGSGNVLVSGSDPWTITFREALERTPLALTASGASLTGPDSPYTVTPASTAASAARRWYFLPSMTAADSVKNFTLEKGSGSNGGKCPWFQVTDLALDFAMKGCDLKLEGFGQEYTDGITMTADPTDIAVAAVSPDNVDIYVGDSILGLTNIGAFKGSWSLKDRMKPVFKLDADEPSYSDTVEAKFQQNAQIVLEQASTANGFMTDLRNKTTKYCRIVATGGSIESGYVYRIQITFPFKFRNPKRGDNEGVYSGTYDLEPIYNSTFGGSIEIVVENALTAL
jgi:hypothetical protein